MPRLPEGVQPKKTMSLRLSGELRAFVRRRARKYKLTEADFLRGLILRERGNGTHAK